MLHVVDVERDIYGMKEGSNLEKGLQVEQNLKTIKSSIPQVVVAFAATKNLGELNKTI